MASSGMMQTQFGGRTADLAPRAAPTRAFARTAVVARASQAQPTFSLAQKAAAAAAAAALTLTPLSAIAAENVLDLAFTASGAELQRSVGLEGLFDKAKAGASDAKSAAKDAAPGGSPLDGAKDASKGAANSLKEAVGNSSADVKNNIDTKRVSFNGFANLQRNVGLEGLVDSAKGGLDKASGKVKEATGDKAGGSLEGVAGAAKQTAGEAKNKVSSPGGIDTKPVSWWTTDVSRLQVNVGADEPVKLSDKVKAASSTIANSSNKGGTPSKGTDDITKPATDSVISAAKDAAK